jgi:hypothetical protein
MLQANITFLTVPVAVFIADQASSALVPGFYFTVLLTLHSHKR